MHQWQVNHPYCQSIREIALRADDDHITLYSELLLDAEIPRLARRHDTVRKLGAAVLAVQSERPSVFFEIWQRFNFYNQPIPFAWKARQNSWVCDEAPRLLGPVLCERPRV
jgi:hypothetical protein